jgi:hypothetical protein
MFIEPGLKAKIDESDGTSPSIVRFPDLVICNTKEVIGIVELKYQPRGRPNWQKDLQTFEFIVKNRDQIYVSNARYRGIIADDREYSLAKDILFVWAGIHAEWDGRLADHIDRGLMGYFLELHAQTKHMEQPCT